MTRVGHVVYLHGFASSPGSSKARRYGEELARHGVGYSCPDFNEPAFESLTVTRMLDQTARAIAGAPTGPVALVGSSLGGFVAVHAADRDTTGRVDRLVLLAPAFDFGGNRLRRLGSHGVDEWRRDGKLRIFHYAHGGPRDVSFALYEDAARYDAFALQIRVPVLVYHGRRDASVDPGVVTAWCDGRPGVSLRLVDDEHQLSASMDLIWAESEGFLGLGR